MGGPAVHPSERDPILVSREHEADRAVQLRVDRRLDERLLQRCSRHGTRRAGPRGRLVSLLVVPDQHAVPGPAAVEPDWDPLLRATGVDVGKLAAAAPEWAPPVFAEHRSAWTGSWPEKPTL